MKKELDYFSIDGVIGGSQDWLTNYIMHFGGCAAVAACDVCIQLACQKGLTALYPFDIKNLSRDTYNAFTQIMKPYLRPRIMGVKKTAWFIEGFEHYLADRRVQGFEDARLTLTSVEGTEDVETARKTLKAQIDDGYPVPYLMLRHQNKDLQEDFEWHWFMIIGYKEKEDDFLIRAATYGAARQVSLYDMWNTGYEERGGIVIVRQPADV